MFSKTNEASAVPFAFRRATLKKDAILYLTAEILLNYKITGQANLSTELSNHFVEKGKLNLETVSEKLLEAG